MTTVTDVIFMTSQPSGWGGFMIVLNSSAHGGDAVVPARRAQATDDSVRIRWSEAVMCQSATSLAATAREDYQALASEPQVRATSRAPAPTPLALPARASELAPTPCAQRSMRLATRGWPQPRADAVLSADMTADSVCLVSRWSLRAAAHGSMMMGGDA